MERGLRDLEAYVRSVAVPTPAGIVELLISNEVDAYASGGLSLTRVRSVGNWRMRRPRRQECPSNISSSEAMNKSSRETCR